MEKAQRKHSTRPLPQCRRRPIQVNYDEVINNPD